MPPRVSFAATGAATVDSDGTLSDELYQELTGTPPTDPTSAIATTGATGTYSEATVTNVTSSIDSSVMTISYDRCHSLGHVGTAKLVPTLLFHGFGLNRGQFDSTFKRRMADYVDVASGRAPLMIAATEGTTNDWARRVYDWKDALTHAVAAVGSSNVYGAGNTCVLIGYSGGTAMAAQFACHFPDLVGALILVYPCDDIGYSPDNSLWARNNTSRSTLTTQVGDRALGTAADIDPYRARYPTAALARILALPNAFDVWIGGDRGDVAGVGLPDPDLLVSALRSNTAAASRVHAHITPNSTDTAILHAEGLSTGGTLLFERTYWPTVLRDIATWSLPRALPTGLEVIGYMESRAVTGSTDPANDRPGWKVWTGANSPPRTDSAGGQLHAGDLIWADAGRQFSFLGTTSQNGKFQVLRDVDDNRTVSFTAGTRKAVNLCEAPVITDLTDIDAAVDQWRADTNVVGGATVTSWTEVTGSKAFATATNNPADTTDGNGKHLVRFTAASSKRMLYTGLLWDPTADFTLVVVANKTSAGTQSIIGEGRGGRLEESKIIFNSNTFAGHYYDQTNADGQNAVGGAGTASSIHCIVYWRKSGVLYSTVDGSVIASSTVVSEWTGTTAVSGSNKTTIGGAFAGNAQVPYEFSDLDLYHFAVFNRAVSAADIWAIYAFMKSEWSF
jgi:pimeloyl-ACP methyl ester carboxylesterase